MVKEVLMYSVCCDNCGAIWQNEHTDAIAYGSPDIIRDEAENDHTWYVHFEQIQEPKSVKARHYCDNCFMGLDDDDKPMLKDLKEVPYRPKVYTWEELYNKAEEKGCDSLFLQIIKEKPMYPREHVNHDVEEFGKKVKPTHKAEDWIRAIDFGYILGYMHPSENPKREKGWFEVCFPTVDAKGNPREYVVGLEPELIEDYV